MRPVYRASALALIGLFAVAGGFGEQAPEKANSHPLYKQLRSLNLSGESSAVNDFSLERDCARIIFKNGRFHFLTPVEGRVTGAVFLGEGVFQIAPVRTSEQIQLGILTGEGGLADKFEKMLIRFTDGTYDEIVKASPAERGSPDSRAQGVVDDVRGLYRKGRNYQFGGVAAGFVPYNMAERILIDLSRPLGNGFFWAQFDGHDYGDLVFAIDPLGLPFVAPEEVALVGLSENKLGIWVSEHLKEHYQGPGSPDDERHGLIDIEAQTIDATVDKDHLTASALTRFKANEDAVRVLAFDLFPRLRVSRVSDEQGRELNFVQEDKDEDADFAVILEEPLAKGKSSTLKFEYAGDDALIDSGGGNYTLAARSNWYPASYFGDRALFDITLHAPKKLEMVATGDLVESREEDKMAVTRWKSDIPLAVAGFNYGQFKKSVTQDKEVGYTIETYANRYIPDYLKALQHAVDSVESPGKDGRGGVKTGLTIGAINTTAMMDKARAEAQTSIRIYTSKFGPLPYGRLAMSQQPSPSFGQAWPMLVYMPLSAFLDSTYLHQLFGDSGNSFFKYVAAHEVAHQWWGHLVGWKSYRDQWMSEGFAEFSASLFSQLVYGNDKFRELWKEHRESILQRNSKGFRPIDAGAVTQGYRLDTAKTGYVTRRMIYPKGAFILHMLRMMMWNAKEGDSRFDAMMKDFVQTHLNKNVSTDDFQKIVEKHMTSEMNLEGNGKMDWFFRQWVYGHDVPRYKLEYRLENQGGGKTKLIGKITQSGVSDNFAMLVPIYIDFGKGDPIRLGSSSIFGNVTTPEFEVMLPQAPKNVTLCWYEDVLAEIDGR